MHKKVMVIAVHPDDETLGAGGTLLKHQANGDEIHCIFCTDIFENEGFSKEQIDTREQEIQEICKNYNFTSIHRLGLKTTKIDEYNTSYLVSLFSQIFTKIKPNILYLPFAYDVHSDHRIIFQAAFSCTKSFRYPSIEKILMMETLSESEFAPALPNQSFIPNVFVDISAFFEKKCEIMKIYQSELGKSPFPRSIENIEALATFRACTMGGKETVDTKLYAESFMLLKEKC
ncbi:PIG-L deacetylase family protein [Campylobacter coli]|uniref:PIG-L deacetylase family protein n=1 Tax=Campylobacter coli TaxID=195 RepID=UPI000A6DFC15|nr:PIG-L deacetylase family protein [Campylobacter coli]EKN8346044.1 PIG-L family deacetylase [Campylobacter coli]BEK08458.1 PIG-L family deacetylase [Campylobacter coli]GML42251.1 PIG-L family deacetylase [Campylobacter coli]GML99066.1 PIG-L family deacetylase [Campylobacter coli]GMM00816.1 PIG-L family deacetylase [Campylobacter coli]